MLNMFLVLTLCTGTYYWKWKPNYLEIRVGCEDMTVNQAVLAKKMTLRNASHRCQPSRNRAGNPAFWLFSRIPAFLPERPAFLALFRNNKNH